MENMLHELDTELRRRRAPHPEPAAHPRRTRLNVAPLNTPLGRRLETLGVAIFALTIPFFACFFFFLVSLGWVAWLVVLLPYFVWFYGVDLHTPTNGKVVYRVKNWTRNLIWWEWYVNYFPIRVHKLCELEPTFTRAEIETPDDEEDLVLANARTFVDKVFKFVGLRKRLNDADPDLDLDKSRRVALGPRYIFGYHPHGVISMGVVGLFGTNVLRNEPFKVPRLLRFLSFLFHDTSGQEPLFPGIGHVFPLTLTTQFAIPVYRDYLLAMGLTSALAQNIRSVISNGDNSVCVVVGGAQELLLNDMVGKTPVGIGYKGSLESEPKKEIRLVLQKRKGFVKLAIELGNVALVPTFGFGEADVYRFYHPKEGSFGRFLQKWLKKNFAFTLPFFSARGIFIYDFGILPYRTPINVCVGRPIYVPPGLLKKEPEEKETDAARLRKLKELAHSSSFSSLLSLGKRKPPPARPQVSQELLDHYHGLYVAELKRVFEDNKAKFGYEDVQLTIIE